MSKKFRKKVQSISNKFQNYFKPNHKLPKTVEKYQPKLCKKDSHLMSKFKNKHLKKKLLFQKGSSGKFARYFKFPKYRNLRGASN